MTRLTNHEWSQDGDDDRFDRCMELSGDVSLQSLSVCTDESEGR